MHLHPAGSFAEAGFFIMIQYYRHNEPFELELGGTLPELVIAYHTYGTLNAARDNAVWVCHALTANSDVADWWPHTVEAGAFLDPDRYFTVCANILGSHYGTTGPLSANPATGEPYYGDFPAITIRDMARAHALLADHLGLDRIKVLVGSSVGGFQAVEWAVEQPERFEKLILIATDAKASHDLTGMPAARMRSMLSRISAPPSSLRASAPLSLMIRTALASATSELP